MCLSREKIASVIEERNVVQSPDSTLNQHDDPKGFECIPNIIDPSILGRSRNES